MAKKKLPQLTLIQCDDYAWLFVNGELVEANHSINWPRVIYNCNLLPMKSFCVDENHFPEVNAYLEERGDLPEDLSVFGLGGEEAQEPPTETPEALAVALRERDEAQAEVERLLGVAAELAADMDKLSDEWTKRSKTYDIGPTMGRAVAYNCSAIMVMRAFGLDSEAEQP